MNLGSLLIREDKQNDTKSLRYRGVVEELLLHNKLNLLQYKYLLELVGLLI
jgi:hypothetical protein